MIQEQLEKLSIAQLKREAHKYGLKEVQNGRGELLEAIMDHLERNGPGTTLLEEAGNSQEDMPTGEEMEEEAAQAERHKGASPSYTSLERMFSTFLTLFDEQLKQQHQEMMSQFQQTRQEMA